MPSVDPFVGWCQALEGRHLRTLAFKEVRRGLEALSALYVERRVRLGDGAALAGAGKRAAFALFYGPLHFLVTRTVAQGLGLALVGAAIDSIVDLGCGTGAASSALAIECTKRPSVVGVDVSRWAIEEARWAWQHFGISAQGRIGDAVHVAQSVRPGRGTLLLAAYTVNELAPGARDELQRNLFAGAAAGAQILIVEPIARRAMPWWQDWQTRFEAAGGRADEWSLVPELPPTLKLLDKAAGLRHQVMKARSLYLGNAEARLTAVVLSSGGKPGDPA